MNYVIRSKTFVHSTSGRNLTNHPHLQPSARYGKLPDCPKIEQNVSNLSDSVISCPIPESQNRTSWSYTDNTEDTYKTIICQAVLKKLHSWRGYAATLPGEWFLHGRNPMPKSLDNFWYFGVNRWSLLYSRIWFYQNFPPKLVSDSHLEYLATLHPTLSINRPSAWTGRVSVTSEASSDWFASILPKYIEGHTLRSPSQHTGWWEKL